MIEQARLKQLNDAPERSGRYVLYWMQQSHRVSFNPALEVAIASANRLGLPVLVCFGLTDGFPEANARHYTFMLEGLRDVEAALKMRGIAFILARGSPEQVAIRFAEDAALVVCDRGYLRIQKQWRKSLADTVGCRVLQVEGDVVVPVEQVSGRREVAARTIRPKLMRLRDEFLKDEAPAMPERRADALDLPRSLDLSDIPALVASLDIDHSVAAVTRFRGGYSEARRRLDAFIEGPLLDYAESRNEPAREHVSFLAAHLHFGEISPVEVALAVKDTDAASQNRASYLDELIIRRELAMNFVEFEPDYDRYSCLPSWARQTLEKHQRDPRPQIYSVEELAAAETHDPYWNASMREMRDTGYMHNHMRMYWGKKILEWSASPQAGYATALRLNNTYFLCGRNPNSFANIGWCFGLHDRPWPERPIFGTVRTMTASGLKRKIDIDAYVARVAELTQPGQLSA